MKTCFSTSSSTRQAMAIEVGIGGGEATLPILKEQDQRNCGGYGQQLSEFAVISFREFSTFSVVTFSLKILHMRIIPVT